MESKPQKAVRPLTPDLMGEKYPRPFIDFSKHLPWLKGKMDQPPADQKIVIHQEEKKQ